MIETAETPVPEDQPREKMARVANNQACPATEEKPEIKAAATEEPAMRTTQHTGLQRELPETASSFALPAKRKRRKGKNNLRIFACCLALIAAVAATIYFGFLLFRGPKVKAVAARPAQKGETTRSSTVPAAPASAPKEPKQMPLTLPQIAKMEAAKRGTPTEPPDASASSNAEPEYVPLKLEDPRVVEAQEVLAEYEMAVNWRDRLPYVFEPERVEPLLREQYEKRGQSDPEHGSFLGAGLLTSGTSQVINVRYACRTRTEAGLRANFHRSAAGKLLLDWESWAAWSDKTWPTFKQERPQTPVLMRAIASESDYYNYEFSDARRWLAVKLRSPDGEHSVTGYVKRGSAAGFKLAQLTGAASGFKLPDGTPMPPLHPPGSKTVVTVRLAFPSNAQSDHCVNITELLADRWLLFPGEAK